MRRRWLMLGLGTASQTAACLFVYGIPYLAPELLKAGVSLAYIGLLVACPTAGLLLTLVAWGAAADRRGERRVIFLGLAVAAVCLACVLPFRSLPALGALFAVAGAASASVFAASGSLVLGWFPAGERGLAMGLRQTATPLGMGLAALLVPGLAQQRGSAGAVLFFATALGVTALAVGAFVRDPPRIRSGPPLEKPGGESGGRPQEAASPPGGNPYRSPALWRIHFSSALLVVPQFTVSAFALVFLVSVREWDPVDAGRLLAVAQALGAVGRIAAGRWSDRIVRRDPLLSGKGRQYIGRLRPMRRLAVANTAVLALLAVCAAWPTRASDVVLVLACALTASTNGLSYTASAELAGPAWTGRVLGVQNTGQNLVAALAPPFAGALISGAGYPRTYAVAACFAAVAALVVPIPGALGRSGSPPHAPAAPGNGGSEPHPGAMAPDHDGAGPQPSTRAAHTGRADRRVRP